MSAIQLKTLDDVPVDGQRVLLRVDINVTVGDDGRVDETEDYRLEAVLPTIQELQRRRCRIILLAHRGRPQEDDTDTSLEPIRQQLEYLLHEPIRTTKTFSGSEVDSIVTGLEPGGMVLLPNVRLDSREEAGNTRFAGELARSADVYVNEAFSVSHRAHTSIAFVPQVLPACAGRRFVEEVAVLQKLREEPERPYVAIVSGAKIKTKVGMLHDLLRHVDTVCIGGRLANVFLADQGAYAADTFLPDGMAAAKSLLTSYKDKIVLPVDVVVGDPEGSATEVVAVEDITADTPQIYDIGPRSVAQIVDRCRDAKTVMWNGPVGKIEVPAYVTGTAQLVQELAKLSSYRVVGGGDTVIAVERERLVSRYDHVSVGGGAMVAFMEGKRLPGIEPLLRS